MLLQSLARIVLYNTVWHVESVSSDLQFDQMGDAGERGKNILRKTLSMRCRQEYFSYIPGKDMLKVLKATPGKSQVLRVSDVKS